MNPNATASDSPVSAGPVVRHDLDLCDDFVVNPGLSDMKQLLDLQATIAYELLTANAKDHRLKYNPNKIRSRVTMYMWVGILLDLLDKKIDVSSFKNEGAWNGCRCASTAPGTSSPRLCPKT